MITEDLRLLEEFVQKRSEEAFSELVKRHLNLVYSAALRQIRSPQLAEEVAQSVFTDLARNAKKLKADTILTAWLYQVTRRTAVDVIRRESRRQIREQIAAQTLMQSTSSDWESIEPLLDEAMDSLDDSDRAAILLRFFENQSLREVGQALGTSDDAAQKRVSRAVEKLREFFAKQGKTVAATALAGAISANAVQAAPTGLALAISTAAIAGVASVPIAIAATKTIAMTTMQKTLIGTAIAAVVGTGLYGVHRNNQLHDQIASLQRTQTLVSSEMLELSSQNQDLSRELEQARRREKAVKDKAGETEQANELLRLRGTASLSSREIADLKAALAQGGKIPEPLIKMFNKYLAAYEDAEKQSQKNSALNRLKRLSEKLSLSDDQQQQAREVLLANIEARARIEMAGFTGSLPLEEVRAARAKMSADESSALAAVFSDEQMKALEQMDADDADAHYKVWAQAMANQMKSRLKLTPEQLQQFSSILYNLKPGEGGENIPRFSNAQEQLDVRMRALEGVLSPEQAQVYRQKILDDIEEHNEIAQITKALKQ